MELQEVPLFSSGRYIASEFRHRQANTIRSDKLRRRGRVCSRTVKALRRLCWWGMLQLANARLRARFFVSFVSLGETVNASSPGTGRKKSLQPKPSRVPRPWFAILKFPCPRQASSLLRSEERRVGKE